jgi:acetylornithine deacetylase/succinyl-diaminopimelate desuccinylase-like protein
VAIQINRNDAGLKKFIEMLSPQKIIVELSDLIAFPSVSSESHQKEVMKACATWLAQHLQSIGMHRARLYKTSSHPVVVAEYNVDPSLQTILFYGHYDVQPVDPLSKWHSHPFKAQIRGDYI